MGWGSWPQEFGRFGLENGEDAPARVARLDRDLALIRQYWGEGSDTGGASATIQEPCPTNRIPLVLGGTGKKTMELVRKYADWWNVPSHQLDRLPALLPTVGSVRVSLQQMVAFVGPHADRSKVTEVATRRFGYLGSGLVCGDAAELVEHFAALSAQGVERFYVWFADFAKPETLTEFADTVMASTRGTT